MTDTTPNPGPGDRALIERRLKSTFQTDPMDRLLQDYRPMTRADVLRFDVHQTGEPGQPGKITPLYRTDWRMTPRPLRILRGFLHRLDSGFHAPVRVTGGEQPAPNVTRPGHGLVTLVTSPQGVIDASGEIGNFAWNEGLRRKRGTGIQEQLPGPDLPRVGMDDAVKCPVEPPVGTVRLAETGRSFRARGHRRRGLSGTARRSVAPGERDRRRRRTRLELHGRPPAAPTRRR